MTQEATLLKKRNFRGRTLVAGIALGAVVGGGTGAAISKTSGSNEHLKQEVKSLQLEQSKVQKEMTRIALHESIAHDLAVQQAAEYTKALNEGAQAPRKSVYMQILNGTIETTVSPMRGAKGGPTPVYKDPILLTLLDESRKPDAKGDFLQGGWIGIKGNDKDGKVVITAVPYYSETSVNVFVPNDPNNIVMSVAAYAASNKGGPGYAFYDIYAADVRTNEPLVHKDGSPVQPGMSLSMK